MTKLLYREFVFMQYLRISSASHSQMHSIVLFGKFSLAKLTRLREIRRPRQLEFRGNETARSWRNSVCRFQRSLD